MSRGIADRCNWFQARCGGSLPSDAFHPPGRGADMEIIRNLTRRKLRNTLTISGIVIGVLALVTMGAMAEKFNALIDGGVAYFGGNIQVGAAGSSAFGGGSVLAFGPGRPGGPSKGG